MQTDRDNRDEPLSSSIRVDTIPQTHPKHSPVCSAYETVSGQMMGTIPRNPKH